MAGTPEKMLEHLLETRLDNKGEEELGMYRGNLALEDMGVGWGRSGDGTGVCLRVGWGVFQHG